MMSFENFFEWYNIRPFISIMLIGIIFAVVGVFIILRKIVFLVDGIAHSAFTGGILGILLNTNPFLMISVFGLGTSLTMGFFSEKGKLNNDTAIGIVFAAVMALGIIFYKFISAPLGLNFLIGNPAAVTPNEFYMILIIGIITCLIIYFIRKELYFMTFDEELARANGISVSKINFLFLIVIALIIICSINIIGVILIIALFVTPAASAYFYTYKIENMILMSIIISIVGTTTGYIIAYFNNFTPTGTIVMLLTGIFVISFLISPKRLTEKFQIDEEYCVTCREAIELRKVCHYCEDNENNLPISKNIPLNEKTNQK